MPTNCTAINFCYRVSNYSTVFGINGTNTLPRSYCTFVPVGLNENENDGLEEILDESHDYLENSFMQIKDFLYQNLPNDDELLVEINNCTNEDGVSIFLWICGELRSN